MAFREVYGGQDKPGRRYKFKDDLRRNVEVFLLIKPVTGEIREDMNSKYADRKRNRATGGYDFNIPSAKDVAAAKFMAGQCWDDIENGWVILGDKEAVKFYNEQLQPSKNGEAPYAIGQQIQLDTRMTQEIKDDMLSDDLPLANWIVRKATDAEEEAAEEDTEVLQKNSRSSSTSATETTEQSPIRSVESAS